MAWKILQRGNAAVPYPVTSSQACGKKTSLLIFITGKYHVADTKVFPAVIFTSITNISWHISPDQF